MRKKIGLLASGLLILGGLWSFRRWQEKRLYTDAAGTAAGVEDVPQVKAYKVRPRRVTGALKRVGTVRAKSETNLQFGARGRIEKYPVEKGQFVPKGALVAQLAQDEAQNILHTMELELQGASVKYFQDHTMDKLEFERVKARYKQAKLDFDKTTLFAPHAGYLVEKTASAGEQADAGTVIGKLVEAREVFIEMDLSEDDVPFLKKGQAVEVTVDAAPDFAAEGRVTDITPYLRGDTRSFGVKVHIPKNPDEKLRPGMFARCTIRRYDKEGAMVVPLEAGLEMTDKEAKVFLLDETNVVHARKSRVLFQGEGVMELDGLKDGDLVLLHPPTTLSDGAKVAVTGVYDAAMDQKK